MISKKATEHPYYNTTNFPILVGTNCGKWNFYASEDGERLAAIPVDTGSASTYGNFRHVAGLIRDYPTWGWRLTKYAKEKLARYWWIEKELEAIPDFKE